MMRCKTMTAVAAMAFGMLGVMAADDAADARGVIDRALQTAGGVDRLTQPRAYTFKQELTTRNKKAPDGVKSTATFYVQPPKKFRMEEEGQIAGRTVTYVEVINGGRGWGKRDGVVRPLSPQIVAHPLEVQQGFGYKFILLLRDQAWSATSLGPSTVNDQPVIGIKLTRPVGRGSEERRLFFDAKSTLLVRSELRAKLSTGAEMATEQTWGDYKTIDEVAVPHRVMHVVKDAAGSSFERVYRDFRFVEQHDPKQFDQP
jgi:hypothetical protein